MKKTICIIIIVICITSCNTIPPFYQPDAANKYDFLLSTLKIAINLSSTKREDNIAGLDRLGRIYNVEITKPVIEFVDSAKILIQALKTLQSVMSDTNKSRGVQRDQEDLKELFDTLDSAPE